jgi:hypothetical protein
VAIQSQWIENQAKVCDANSDGLPDPSHVVRERRVGARARAANDAVELAPASPTIIRRRRCQGNERDRECEASENPDGDEVRFERQPSQPSPLGLSPTMKPRVSIPYEH